MALVKSKISKNLQDFLISLQDASTLTSADRKKIEKYADGFSEWLISSMKDAQVTVSSGIPVGTTGGAGSTTGPGSGTIS